MDGFLIRLGLALLLGTLIGLERQLTHHIAGLRTNGLVSAGASLFMMMGSSLGGDAHSRVAAQIISGIGFLGGGVILRDGLHIRGLTTAATLWCSSAVGTLAGGGLMWEAAMGTAVIIATNVLLRPLSQKLGDEGNGARYRLIIVCPREAESFFRNRIAESAMEHNFEVSSCTVEVLNAQEISLRAEMRSRLSGAPFTKVADAFAAQDGIRSIEWQKLD
jgi:putative Mg2+ transporter-C (MgtC) family protein